MRSVLTFEDFLFEAGRFSGNINQLNGEIQVFAGQGRVGIQDDVFVGHLGGEPEMR